ncbi:HEAT repeat domain-containing protein [Pedobacter sp. Du54]|uniref:HEAT repeat domain-containing protein n=1 Tax=Pedobacter anseongensis TaxID=3133439 RepID=UPI003097545F
MLIYLKLVKNRRSKYKKWKNIADLLVRDAIFSENADVEFVKFPINHRTEVLLKNARFRRLLTKEILLAKKNMSGVAGSFLQKLYLQLGLDHYALINLQSKKWHIKAKAIQDLGIMDLKEHLSKIYRHTNNQNELIRMEAQISVIKLTGFEGLRFLDVVSYQITDWQQIKLLNELSFLPAHNFSGIEKWLLSKNESVVIFALKLAKNFHRFELYQQVEACLDHFSKNVRRQAIFALEKIYIDETSKMLLERYSSEVEQNQIAIVKTLQQIGNEEDIPVLISFLEGEEPEQKRAIVRTIAHLSENGIAQVRLLPESAFAPLSLILKQIEGELSA